MLDNIAAFLNGEDITHETASRPRPLALGLLAGTRIATTMGWRPVDALAQGDRVLTFDEGLQQITRVSRVRLWDGSEGCPESFWPLHVPPGALGNRTAMDVLPGQGVMIESDAAEEIYGDPFALIPAQAIEGRPGVERAAPSGDLSVIVLHFASEQVVFSDNGALFYCPASYDAMSGSDTAPPQPLYTLLSLAEARRLTEGPSASTERPVPAASTSDAWSAAVLAFARSKLSRDSAPYAV
ncbi:MAG: Hint domain-containing protein [Pseudomonadota bacterium]